MNRTTLLALASRVEAATGADSECVIREASWAVNVMLANRQDLHDRVNVLLGVDAYESAAMSLVPSGWNHGYSSRQGTEPSWRVVAQCWNAKPASTLHGEASTPALALTAASLRAIAGSLTE